MFDTSSAVARCQEEKKRELKTRNSEHEIHTLKKQDMVILCFYTSDPVSTVIASWSEHSGGKSASCGVIQPERVSKFSFRTNLQEIDQVLLLPK